jgi:hypothetical protein
MSKFFSAFRSHMKQNVDSVLRKQWHVSVKNIGLCVSEPISCDIFIQFCFDKSEHSQRLNDRDKTSVADSDPNPDPPDPDPPDPRVFGPTGSGSGSTSQRYGSWSCSCSGSFYHHAKIVRKTLIPTILWLLLNFYLWKMMCKCSFKSHKQKKLC